MSKLQGKIALFFAAAALLLGVFSAQALAAPADGPQELTLEAPDTVWAALTDADPDADPDALIEGYIEQSFDAALPDDEISLRRGRANDYGLTGTELDSFNLVRPLVAEVASGKRVSSEFVFDIVDVLGTNSWTAADLGVGAVVVNGQIVYEAAEALWNKLNFDITAVMRALQADCPYELYWFDKTQGMGYDYSDVTATYDYGLGEWVLHFASPAAFTIHMYVSSDYSLGGESGSFDIDTATGARVATAVDNAKRIAAEGSDLAPYYRLEHFKDRICALTSYNHPAADDPATPYGDPWQLIYVFDGIEEDDTMVVCEGYSKAFQYLCDMAKIPGVSCYTVYGTMKGGLGSGEHMWNLVRMDDGRVYLVDVTNSDSDSGAHPDNLFVAPCSSGSVAGGYVFDAGSKLIPYAYDPGMFGSFTVEELTVSTTAYDKPAAPASISEADIAAIADQPYTGYAVEPDVTVTLGGTPLVEGRDYTVYYANNVEVGEATAIVVCAGEYRGFKLAKFAITPSETPAHAPGWANENGGWYFYDGDGTFRTDTFMYVAGKYYYLGKDGKLVTGGWIEHGGAAYYIDSDWSLALNRFVKYGSAYYYFGADAQLVANTWKQIGDKWYYFDKNAQLAVSAWKQIGGKWYSFGADAQPVTNTWFGSGDSWYYLKPDGTLAVNEWVDYYGYACHFNAKGICDYAAAA